MRTRLPVRLLQLVVILLSILQGSLEAQEPVRAFLRGTVRSHDGAPASTVRVTFTPGGQAAVTDSRGAFVLPVPPSTQGVLTFRVGNHEVQRASVKPLAAGATRDLSVVLTSVFAVDALSVTAQRERPLLDTYSGVTGGTVGRTELEALPSDARNLLSLAYTIPGVSQSTGFFGDAPPLTLHGGNSLYTQYFVDGLDNNEGFLGGQRVEFPLAAASRLDVLASGYGAVVGRSANGVVDVTSRSGGAVWDGELFVFGRPGMPLDAPPKFTPAGTDPDGFRRLQIGGAAGGPLSADKSFLFAAGEYSNEREDRIGSTARAQFIGTELRETWKLFGRLDHGWTDHQTTTLRFAFSDVQRKGQGGGVIVPEADITTIRRGSLTGVTHRSLLTDRSSNTVSAQLGTFRWDFPPTTSDLATPQIVVVAPDLTTVEAVVGSSNFVFDERETQLQLRDVLEFKLGARHQLRAGGDLSRSWFRLHGSSTNPRGVYTVVNEGNIAPAGRFLSISDVPADVRVIRYSIDANPQQVDLTQTLIGLFIEDEWRPAPSLTVHAGLRWDYDDITSRGESNPDLNNLQPRLALNWLMTRSTVLRGATGIYTGRFPYAIYSDAVQFGEDGNAVVTLEGSAFPPPALGAGPSAGDFSELRASFPPREIRRMFALGLEQPESYHFSLGLQRQMGERWSFAVDGVWIETRHLPRSWDLNPIGRPLTEADTLHRPASVGDEFRPVRPELGSYRRLTTTETGGTARYRGLYTTLRARVGSRSAFEASWVWSRAQNDTEDINFNAAQANDFANEWADAINDRRHHITVRSFIDPLPSLRLAAIADYQTGTPVNRIAYFRDLDGSGDIFGNGFVGNHDRFAGVRRNAERLEDAFQLSAAATLRVPVQARALELRADVFNVLNSRIITGFANGIPGGGPRTQTGRPGDAMNYTTAAPPRQIQLSARYAF